MGRRGEKKYHKSPRRRVTASPRQSLLRPLWLHMLSRFHRTVFTPHIFLQYSRMERSEENLPMRAAFRIAIRVQRF